MNGSAKFIISIYLSGLPGPRPPGCATDPCLAAAALRVVVSTGSSFADVTGVIVAAAALAEDKRFAVGDDFLADRQPLPDDHLFGLWSAVSAFRTDTVRSAATT